jgi:hypothetical protein
MPRARTMFLLSLAALMCAVISIAACRRGVPVVDPGDRPPTTDGTVSGTVRGPEGTSAIADREVRVINVETGERQVTRTNNAGGFTFKVKPGKYRVELALLNGESLLKQPGVMTVNRSDVDAHADFVVGSGKVARPRPPSSQVDWLGPPIA